MKEIITMVYLQINNRGQAHFELLYKDYKNKKLLKIKNCKGGDNLVEIFGTFNIQKLTNDNEIYYLTDIEKIYDFDTRPKNIGSGNKYQCYPN